MRLKIDISGQKNIIDNLKKFGEDGEISTHKIVKSTSQAIYLDAKEKAPVNLGNLRANIVNEEIEPLAYQVTAKAYYSAYLEFGTGGKVGVPSEWNDIALSFKNNSKGTYADGIKRIKEWLKKKGGDPNNAEFIFLLILKNGIEPQPFMYPAFLFGRKIYKKDMDFEWQKLIKKYNNE